MMASPAQVFTRVEEKMCTFAAKKLAAVTLVVRDEWNWNCTQVETYPARDQTLFSARAGVAERRMMLDGMIEHFFASPSDFQLCSSHTPLESHHHSSTSLWRQPLNQLVRYWDRRETRLVCSPPPHLSHTGGALLALQGRLSCT